VGIDELLARIYPPTRSRLRKVLTNGGFIPTKDWPIIHDALVALSPAFKRALAQIVPTRDRIIDALAPPAREIMALEQEATTAALRIAGFNEEEREKYLNWQPHSTGRQRSFLDGLNGLPLRENTMIMNDLQFVPGFRRLAQTKFGAVSFENDAARLILLHANHERLEETIGVDLMYYNNTYRSFVCVQYKVMKEEAGGATFRYPQGDLEQIPLTFTHTLHIRRNLHILGH
jgi:hypothetical protein